ncbi:TonB-dependent receptor [Candidatus Neomarinimicrobiota bacterium]
MNRIVKILMVLVLPFALFAQNTITGTVSDAANGNGLSGANVVVGGTTMGAAADVDGYFVIENVPDGTFTLTASVIGYENGNATITLPGVGSVDFALTASALEMSALEVFASRATRNTPVAYSNVEKENLEFRLGSQDIPMVLNLTPSVYATQQGGGAGDARVNVRGFNQRNVAVMINGVPVNDMENGWVYWSNWDGVADATSSIQMQRGLSAVNLATPSIGGTMNIITDPAAIERGGKFRQEYGSGTFLKTTASYHSGLINDKLAFGATVVRKTGDGVIDKAWTDAWAYYFGASYALNEAHRLEFYAVGAPQRHGQMRYKQNIGAFDHDFAKSLDDYDEEALDQYTEASMDRYGDYDDAEAGRFYNENWNVVDSDYDGKQYYYMYGAKEVDRHDPDFLNESENYFHKPQVSLNHYWTINDAMRLSSTFYFSGGSGGGTGTFDDMIWDYNGPSRIVDFDGTIAINRGTLDRKGHDKAAGQSVGFLRNSVNQQWTLGAISKLNYDVSEDLQVQFGVDWRTAEIEHFREVRDLLGGKYVMNGDYDPYAGDYKFYYSEFEETDAARRKGLGDKINYNNTNTVDWLGFFGQGEYNWNDFSFYGMGGFSMIKYSLVDHFKKASNYDYDYVTASDDGELTIDADWVSSFQVKGGGLYRVNETTDVFANFGYVEKPPILDNIIDDIEISLATDPVNETFISGEVGANLRLMNGRLFTKLNAYYTMWRDRTVTRNVQAGTGSSGDTDVIFLTGMDQDHLGVEAEIAFQPIDMFRLDAAISYGMWDYAGDVEGKYKDISTQTSEDYLYSIDGLKIGDMPQTIVALGASVYPIDGMNIQAVFNYYDRHWADWDPQSRQVDEGEAPDRDESWQVPSAYKIDLHATYNLPIDLNGIKFQAFAHLFNALDEVYVQDATDNSSYNAYTANGVDHTADDAEVYLSTPRYFNVGVNILLP